MKENDGENEPPDKEKDSGRNTHDAAVLAEKVTNGNGDKHDDTGGNTNQQGDHPDNTENVHSPGRDTNAEHKSPTIRGPTSIMKGADERREGPREGDNEGEDHGGEVLVEADEDTVIY